MKKTIKSITLVIACLVVGFSPQTLSGAGFLKLSKSETLRSTLLVNDYFMRTYPDVGAKSYVGGKERNSKIWTRGVYYEGLMALYRQYPQEKILKYAEDWGNFHSWITAADNAKRHADFQCCGQAFLDMYMLKTDQSVRKTHIKKLIDEMLVSNTIDDWYWIDAIQMSMPIFAQLGTIEKDERYFKRMYEMYMFARNKHGGSSKSGGLPLFNEADGLWYRDYNYDPPYADKKERDKPCYWSRGNGWVYVALSRALYYSPDTVIHRDQYVSDFTEMSKALLNCQREDGFWGVSLAAPTNTGSASSPGPETSGTALFVAGMAYGINTGLLYKEIYLPCVIKGWNALCSAIHEDGFLGYVQGSGACPEDGQPVLLTSTPDFEDFGIGCFLLAAAEVYQLGDIAQDDSSIEQAYLFGDKVGFTSEVVNKEWRISLKSDRQIRISLDIYDSKGALVNNICSNYLLESQSDFSIPVKGMDGYYICVLKTPWGQQTRKVVVN
ncbi:glycoside hydrolase family 88 protein [Viscerimonas tarda]